MNNKINLSLRIVRQMRRGFGTWCTNSYMSDKTPSRCPLDASAGRSMVEMLGVLAIIGVLSVGAIAGYGKAMMKYKLSKQSEQISWLLNVMYRYRLDFGRKPPFMNLIPYFIKLGEIPENMIKDSTNIIYDNFESRIDITTNGCYDDKCSQLILIYLTSAYESFELCQNLFQSAKEFHNELYITGVYKNKNDNYIYGNTYRGSKYCTTDCIRNITQEQIYNQCKYCDEDSKYCKIYFIINIE
jgi:type II secretory pathway pseudopilin PulG